MAPGMEADGRCGRRGSPLASAALPWLTQVSSVLVSSPPMRDGVVLYRRRA
jgi:hypothetical protein